MLTWGDIPQPGSRDAGGRVLPDHVEAAPGPADHCASELAEELTLIRATQGGLISGHWCPGVGICGHPVSA